MKPLQSMTTKSLQARYRRECEELNDAKYRVDTLEWSVYRIRTILERRGATVPTVKE